jgi:hypothetical protein
VARDKSARRLAYDAEERNSRIDDMMRRAQDHRDRANAVVAKVRRAKAKAARLVKATKRTTSRGRKR